MGSFSLHYRQGNGGSNKSGNLSDITPIVGMKIGLGCFFSFSVHMRVDVHVCVTCGGQLLRAGSSVP